MGGLYLLTCKICVHERREIKLKRENWTESAFARSIDKSSRFHANLNGSHIFAFAFFEFSRFFVFSLFDTWNSISLIGPWQSFLWIRSIKSNLNFLQLIFVHFKPNNLMIIWYLFQYRVRLLIDFVHTCLLDTSSTFETMVIPKQIATSSNMVGAFTYRIFINLTFQFWNRTVDTTTNPNLHVNFL